MYQQSINQPFMQQPIFIQTQYIAQQQIPRVQQQRSITPVINKANNYTISYTWRDDLTKRGRNQKCNMINDDSEFMKALMQENYLLKQQVELKRAELIKIIEKYNQYL